jgi:CO/xanthine dehydrogenase Mo-binding subunit
MIHIDLLTAVAADAEKHYAVMGADDIAALPSASLAAKDAHLFRRQCRRAGDGVRHRILRFNELPEVRTRLIARPDEPWGAAGEAGTVATAAALANAVFDATGRHPRRLPLDPEYVRQLI